MDFDSLGGSQSERISVKESTFRITANHILSTPDHKPEVSRNGKEMLQVINEKKETENLQRCLENRVRRLQVEHERTQKKIEETKRRTQQILHRRNENIQLQRQKEEAAAQEQRKIEHFRKTIYDKKLESMVKKRNLVTKLAQEKRQAALRQKQTNRNLVKSMTEEKLLGLKARRDKAEAQHSYLKNASVNRIQRSPINLQTDDYLRRMQQSKTERDETKKNVHDLEQQEAGLLDTLRTTYKAQRKEFKHLEKLVKDKQRIYYLIFEENYSLSCIQGEIFSEYIL